MNSFSKKSIFVLGLFAILFFGLSYFVFLPINDQYKKDKAEYAEKQETFNQNNDKITSLQKIVDKPDDFDKIYTDVSNFWPDTLKVSDFMVQVEGLAKDTGVVIESFSIDEQKQVAAPKVTDEDSAAAKTTAKTKTNAGTKFTMVFSASYATTLNVISRMETLARLNSINSVGLTGTKDGLSVNLSGTIYYGK